MEKNFLNITPESGKGNQEVTINAKANISLEDREEMLRIRSSIGKEASVRITQDGVPFMANIGVVFRNLFPLSTDPIDIIFSKTTWDSEGIPTTELKAFNSDENRFEVIPYFQLLIRKDIADELLPPGEYGNPALYIQDALIEDEFPTGRGVSFNQITIKGIEYYTATTDGSYYENNFYATIGLCYENEEIELFRLYTQRFNIY